MTLLGIYMFNPSNVFLKKKNETKDTAVTSVSNLEAHRFATRISCCSWVNFLQSKLHHNLQAGWVLAKDDCIQPVMKVHKTESR